MCNSFPLLSGKAMPIAFSETLEMPRGPIFIVGAPRSGTSMLHWALVQHKNLWGSAESGFINKLIEGVEAAYASGTKVGEFHWLIKEKVSKDELFKHIGKGVKSLYLSRSQGIRWVDQTPHYVSYYVGLNAMFPEAKFIHIVRDGRQVISSMQAMFGWTFAKAMYVWKHHVSAGNAINKQSKSNFLQIRYESVILNPERMFREIYEFIEESFDSNSIGFLDKPINVAPGREAESSTDKLIPKWESWNPYRRKAFQVYCGRLMKDLEYTADIQPLDKGI